jgi:hypothetical protein
MTTIDIVLPDGTIEAIELACESCGLDLALAESDAPLLDRLLCGDCTPAVPVTALGLAA